ncbi:MAG: hypothetical protein AB8B86_10020 [Pseudomonadales bacterium]
MCNIRALIRPIVVVFLSVSGVLTHAADDKPAYEYEQMAPIKNKLRHNPFERAFRAKARSTRGYGPLSQDISAEMELKAVLFDEVNPLVNVGGRILALGEEHQGYTLREVTRETAVFYKQGRATLLQLEPSEEDSTMIASDDGYQ